MNIKRYIYNLRLKDGKQQERKLKEEKKEKRMAAIKRLGELLEKTGAAYEENIKIIREVREENYGFK